MKLVFERVSYETAPEVKRLVLGAVEAGDEVIDLSMLRHADSTMLSILLAAARCAKRRGSNLVIRAMPAELESLAALYGVSGFLPLERNRTEAA